MIANPKATTPSTPINGNPDFLLQEKKNTALLINSIYKSYLSTKFNWSQIRIERQTAFNGLLASELRQTFQKFSKYPVERILANEQ
ncbi:unnamed protein product [Clavelina lepadiformis]|uniref:Uncharacterized protein n=1 Tax=Clavelina lepadiformis TaxID=159417 RepID=A0ABP0FZ68_CLALP